MTTRNDILQLLRTKNSNCIENKRVIVELVKNGDIDKLISKIMDGKLVKLINFKLFEKKHLNCIEQFVVNLDAFISYYSEQLLVGESYQYVLASIFLKSKYSHVLLSKRFIYDGGDNQQYYYSNFKKMMTEQFLRNLMIMRIYIYKYLKNTNIYLERLNYSDKSYNLVFELLVSLFLTNRSNLLVIISNMLMNIRKNYIFNNKQNDEYLRNLGIIWQSVFENFQDKFYYVYYLNSMKYLKYVKENNIVNNNFYNILLRVKSVSSDRIQTMVVDTMKNIISETNPLYIKSLTKRIIINYYDIKVCEEKGNVILSTLCFDDGTSLERRSLMYSICNNGYVAGYILFILPNNFNKEDRRYINIILGEVGN